MVLIRFLDQLSASYLKSVMPSVGEWQLNPNLPEINRKLLAGFIVPAKPPLPGKAAGNPSRAGHTTGTVCYATLSSV